MSNRTLTLDDRTYAYLLSHSLREDPRLARLRAETASHPQVNMQIAPEQGQFMQMLVRLTGARRAIEVGVFTGYSSLAVMLAMPPDGRLLALDVSEEFTAVARRHWRDAGVADRIELVIAPGLAFKITAVTTLVTGTLFLMWLGEQVTERGIGNGISMVIFSGIVVGIPSGIAQVIELIRTGQFNILQALLFVGLVVLVIGAVFYVESAQRRIPIQHARRVVGRQMMQGGLTYFPLRVNTAGVIPPIFASSLLVFPSTIAQFANVSPTDPGVMAALTRFIQDYLDAGGWLYNGLYVALIIFFAFFYTAIVINPDDVADNLKRQGGSIPGIRPGAHTAQYIDGVLGRLTLVGAVYISVICIMPVALSTWIGLPFYFGGTALLIVVGVAKDLLAAIEAHLLSHQYQGFVQGVRMRGRFSR